MPAGLKASSSPIIVSFSVSESAANTFTQAQVDLALNVLDREVFVVTGVNLDASEPEAIAGTNTKVRTSLSTTSRTNMGTLDDSNVIAVSRSVIQAAGMADSGIGFTQSFGETPAIGMDYLAIIATNDFFLQIQGDGNSGAKAMTGKLYGYRAIADANTFAALAQSELLSA